MAASVPREKIDNRIYNHSIYTSTKTLKNYPLILEKALFYIEVVRGILVIPFFSTFII